ncbi:MAG: fructose,6-bisphosphatase [Pseudomonadota bacterium]|jgi:fructose-1,6-bisphosphatase II / sedoheptulose-1,7-bisphosphatase
MKEMILDIISATEAAAIGAYDFKGSGNETMADAAAVCAMRNVLNNLPITSTIVIGEGERDKAPMLAIGENLGTGGMKLDIAVDPLEGTTILAQGKKGALSVLACTKSGDILNAPDLYMEKIAIGFDFTERIIDLDCVPSENLKNIAAAKRCNISDLRVMILNRPRHEELIAKVQEAGAIVTLISDGDIAAVIATSIPTTGVDVYMGIGGAPEGVLAAASLKTSGGQMCARLIANSNEEKNRATKLGILDLKKQYFVNDMVKSDALFLATGVTDGYLVEGVSYVGNKISTETLVMFSQDRTIRKIKNIRNA